MRLSLSIATALLLLTACGPTHRNTPFLEVGSPLQLTVSVPSESVANASAEVFYRLPSTASQYQRQTLTQRGSRFHTTLPTESLREGEAVAYYFDVMADGKLTALRSPDRPYLTTFVSRNELVLRSLSDSVKFKDDRSEIVFKVSSSKFSIGQARVIYSPPDLAGYVVEDMQRTGSTWSLTIPPKRIAPGVWSYRIEAEVEDTLYTLPDPGQWETFKLEPAPKPVTPLHSTKPQHTHTHSHPHQPPHSHPHTHPHHDP